MPVPLQGASPSEIGTTFLSLPGENKFRLFFAEISELGSLFAENLAVTMFPFNSLSAKTQY
jgi:hypothetical protein